MVAMLLGFSALARSQESVSNQTSPPGGGPQPSPATEELLERLRKMEEVNQKLSKKVEKIDQQNQDLTKKNEDLSRENKNLSKQFRDLSEKLKSLEKAQTTREEGAGPEQEQTAEEPGYEPAGARSGDVESGGRARSGGLEPGQEAQLIGNRRIGKLKIKTRYNYEHEGLQFATEDDEFELKVRVLLQADSRLYTRPNQDPVHSGFYLPRTRFYFTSHVTRPIEYNISFQRAYNTFNVLNAYLNFHYDDRFQVRFGRFKTPFTYEYYKLHV